MLFVFPLFLAANLPGRIKTAAKHPLLAAEKIWAFAHLLLNGTLADVLLFGSFFGVGRTRPNIVKKAYPASDSERA
jgi:uncharacterized membrane protein